MDYKIIYGKESGKKQNRLGLRVVLMTIGFFFLFLNAVSYFWPEGRELMKNLVPLRETERTFHAAEVFSQELASGFSVRDAVGNFVDSLLEYGRIH